MQDLDTTSTQSLIDRYYEEEKAQREIEQTLAALTMRMDANDLAMLNVIARRFRKTRDEVAQEVLSNALIDLFARLEAGERKLIARDADELARSLADEIAEENGVMNVDVKSGVWANHDRQITKIERKKAKLMEQQAEQQTEQQATQDVKAESQPVQPENDEKDEPEDEVMTATAAEETEEQQENAQEEESSVSMFAS